MTPFVPEQCHWVVVYDNSILSHPDVPPEDKGEFYTSLHSTYTGHSGNPNRNYALDSITLDDLDWVYVLDDDNIIHPDWYNAVRDMDDPALNMVGWGQVWANNSVRLRPTSTPDVGNIDTSCYMVRGRLMKHLRYHYDYVADGILAREAYSYGGYVKFDGYLGYYNYLRTPADRLV
jgi:hypothetical protein